VEYFDRGVEEMGINVRIVAPKGRNSQGMGT
jgi:hypothetical protein